MRSQFQIEEIFRKMNLETEEQRSKFVSSEEADLPSQKKNEKQFIRIHNTTISGEKATDA